MANTEYWRGLEELNEEPEFLEHSEKEFPEYLPVREQVASEPDGEENSRRDFLKLMGFSVAAVSLAACETPVKKAIPYINKPETIDPGNANYYASSYIQGKDYASVLVKTREGRPIKIDPNNLSSITSAGTSARANASVLSLYDETRLRNYVKVAGASPSKISIGDADKEIKDKLKAINDKGGKIRIVTSSIISPSFLSLLGDFAKKYSKADVKHVQYDPISVKGLVSANDGVLPSYDFSKANVIVGFSCDFLDNWISSIEHTAQYAATRKLSRGKKEDMSRHYQFEANLSLTGSNADYRFPVRPAEEAFLIIELYNKLASKAGKQSYKNAGLEGLSDGLKKSLDKVANDLYKNKGKSLVVSGSNQHSVQLFIRKINELLGNEGSTVDISNNPSDLRMGDELEFAKFVTEAKAKKVDAAFFVDVNPGYNYRTIGNDFEEALKQIDMKVAITDRLDETSSASGTIIATGHHWLESWGDAKPRKGYYSLMQPSISPLFKETRAAADSFIAWAGLSGTYYDYVRSYWEANLFPLQSKDILFDSFWNRTLQQGVFEPKSEVPAQPVVEMETMLDTTSTVEDPEITEEVPVGEGDAGKDRAAANLSEAASRIGKTYKIDKSKNDLVLYESTQMGDGTYANNPWLHELPDPISKVTWDNYLTISIADAEKMGIAQGDIVKVVVTQQEEVEVPAIIQPGQAKGTFGLALGYGRTKAGKLAAGITKENRIKGQTVPAIGVNAFGFVSLVNGTFSYTAAGVGVTNTGKKHKIAQTQTHHTIMGRKNVQGASLATYQKGEPVVENLQYHTSKGHVKAKDIDLWEPQNRDTHKHPIHHWGMVIDLNACTGCSACVVACHSENNVPVVGKDEVARRRDLHWLRIDRYYSSDADYSDKSIGGFAEMENPAENPNVTFQPMMCQHCNHAPCETVCPVAATTHSTEGLNQMAYNRCIGTRYCANNCPYKVRRFNWFNYSDKPWSGREFRDVNVAMNTNLGRMVLNPDVVVRARGVMEKCSMCVQKIQAGKLKAKIEKRKVTAGPGADKDINTACAAACAAGAITFGDMNDPNSDISQERNVNNKDRKFDVLEEINVLPNVSYLAKIKNVDESGEVKF